MNINYLFIPVLILVLVAAALMTYAMPLNHRLQPSAKNTYKAFGGVALCVLCMVYLLNTIMDRKVISYQCNKESKIIERLGKCGRHCYNVKLENGKEVSNLGSDGVGTMYCLDSTTVIEYANKITLDGVEYKRETY